MDTVCYPGPNDFVTPILWSPFLGDLLFILWVLVLFSLPWHSGAGFS
jgi:hypothetical protein